jgi:hypothetical protein
LTEIGLTSDNLLHHLDILLAPMHITAVLLGGLGQPSHQQVLILLLSLQGLILCRGFLVEVLDFGYPSLESPVHLLHGLKVGIGLLGCCLPFLGCFLS